MLRIFFVMVLMMLAGSADELSDAKAEFSRQDKVLNTVYQKLKKGLDPDLFAKVQADQRNWIVYKEYMAEWQARNEDPEKSVERWNMSAGLTESRVKWLRAWLKQDGKQGWEGSYSDSYGGYLRIAETDGKFRFRLSVVRGPTFHLGEIGGEFRVNGGTGWFEVDEGYGDGAAWLTFLQEDDGTGRVKLVGENTQGHHGARAYFDGTYLRTGGLTPQERSEISEGKPASER